MRHRPQMVVLLGAALMGAALMAAAQATPASPLLVAYSDTTCTTANLTGLDAPFYGEANVTVPAGAEHFTLVRVGLANNSSPLCTQPELGLLGPCTEVFLVARSGDTIFGRPLVSIKVAPAPGCDVSHCQGGVLSLSGGGGGADGTFYQRLTGAPDIAVALEDTDFLTTGSGEVQMHVSAEGGLVECGLLYSIASLEDPPPL